MKRVIKRLYCSNCGNQVEINANFCENCGNKLRKTNGFMSQTEEKQLDDKSTQQEINQYHSVHNDPYETTSGLNEEFNRTNHDLTYDDLLAELPEENSMKDDMLVYVGKNSDYYDQKWKIAEVKGTSWNWAGFFLSTGWLGYRKMYKEVLFIALFFLLLDFSLYFIDSLYSLGSLLDIINNGLTIGFAVFVGIYGNTLYKRHTEKNVLLIRNTEQDLNRRDFRLRQKGGTSWGGVFIALGIIIIFYVLPAYFIPFNSHIIEGVKGGTFYDYPSVTVEDLFDTVFVDTAWEYVTSDQDYDYIEFYGVKREYNYDFDVVIQFMYDGEEFQVLNIMIDGAELDDYEITEFLDYIFMEYDRY